jgi:hypothetical protein
MVRLALSARTPQAADSLAVNLIQQVVALAMTCLFGRVLQGRTYQDYILAAAECVCS